MIQKKNNSILPGSFRDPSGFMFTNGGALFRQINVSYKKHYDLLINSLLYDALVSENLLISHKEIEDVDSGIESNLAYKIIQPDTIKFISYPYEWCFTQLKSAALATLRIQKIALDHGMTLKDASAYNMQFKDGQPTFIDTLSFEKYIDGQPWIAYKQFCKHFLAPLALMSYTDVRLNQLMQIYIDGVPLDLANKLLPFKAKLNFYLFSHISLHSKSQDYFSDKQPKFKNLKMSKVSFLGLLDSLESAINGLKWKMPKSQWGNYYHDTNYSNQATRQKMEVIRSFMNSIKPINVWDLGSNTGLFSRISSQMGIETIAFDLDPVAVEKNYLECIRTQEKNLLPLIMDLTNPSSPIGWQNHERMSLFERGPVDTVLALAIIHHLAISENMPLLKIVNFFKMICKNLIIEFVSKEDSQVQKLLSTRADIFPNYTQEKFEEEFSKFFTIKRSIRINETKRTLYLMSI